MAGSELHCDRRGSFTPFVLVMELHVPPGQRSPITSLNGV